MTVSSPTYASIHQENRLVSHSAYLQFLKRVRLECIVSAHLQFLKIASLECIAQAPFSTPSVSENEKIVTHVHIAVTSRRNDFGATAQPAHPLQSGGGVAGGNHLLGNLPNLYKSNK